MTNRGPVDEYEIAQVKRWRRTLWMICAFAACAFLSGYLYLVRIGADVGIFTSGWFGAWIFVYWLNEALKEKHKRVTGEISGPLVRPAYVVPGVVVAVFLAAILLVRMLN